MITTATEKEMENVIDLLIKNKKELSELLEKWNKDKLKVKTNEEYDLILQRIEIIESILY
jgi:hypothetical protein